MSQASKLVPADRPAPPVPRVNTHKSPALCCLMQGADDMSGRVTAKVGDVTATGGVTDWPGDCHRRLRSWTAGSCLAPAPPPSRPRPCPLDWAPRPQPQPQPQLQLQLLPRPPLPPSPRASPHDSARLPSRPRFRAPRGLARRPRRRRLAARRATARRQPPRGGRGRIRARGITSLGRRGPLSWWQRERRQWRRASHSRGKGALEGTARLACWHCRNRRCPYCPRRCRSPRRWW